MLYLIGHKNIPLKREQSSEKCSCCGSEKSVTVTVYQKYVHFFGIPFLPAGKTSLSECSICKKVNHEKEMTANLLAISESLKSAARIPIWMFSGAFAFILLFVYWQIQDRKLHQQRQQFLLSPAVGDVMEVKNKDQQYTLTKIIEIKKDSLFLVSSNYQSIDQSGLIALRDSSYSDQVAYISRADLKALFDKGEILNIIRK